MTIEKRLTEFTNLVYWFYGSLFEPKNGIISYCFYFLKSFSKHFFFTNKPVAAKYNPNITKTKTTFSLFWGQKIKPTLCCYFLFGVQLNQWWLMYAKTMTKKCNFIDAYWFVIFHQSCSDLFAYIFLLLSTHRNVQPSKNILTNLLHSLLFDNSYGIMHSIGCLAKPVR